MSAFEFVIEKEPYNFIVEHIIRRASDARILLPTLPDQLKDIIHTRKNVVHEHDRIEKFSFSVSQLVKRDQCCVSHLGEILDTMIECAPRPLTRANDDAHPDGPQ